MMIATVGDFRKAMRVARQWHFGYDPYFGTLDGGVLCVHCAEDNRRGIIDSISGTTLDSRHTDGWRIAWSDSTANTDNDVICNHCASVLQVYQGDDRTN